jgi:hypothetical protein
VTVTVSDTESPAQSQSVPLTLTVKYPKLQVATSALPAGSQGAAYGPFTVQATGGNGDYAWTAGPLADGLSISSSGVVSGTLAAGGSFPVTVSVADTESPAQSQTVPLTLTVKDPGLTYTPATSLPEGIEGLPYGVNSSAAGVSAGQVSGGDGSYTWTATGLPAGLSINQSTGQITGIITATDRAGAISTVTVTIRDNESPTPETTSGKLSITYYPRVSIITTQAQLDSANFGKLCQPGAKGSCPTYLLAPNFASNSYTWSASGLPPGVSITATGGLGGTLTDAPPPAGSVVGCSYTVKITVTDPADTANTFTATYDMGNGNYCVT